MIKSIIVAMTPHHVIGQNNTLPWHLPDDLRHFKRVTTGNPVIMGRKTYQSIGAKPLPHRVNIVVTNTLTPRQLPGCYQAPSLPRAFQIAAEQGAEELFVIGGSKLYKEALPFVGKLYITEIHADIAGDTFFPPLKKEEWQEVSREEHAPTLGNPYAYAFVLYERR